MVVHDIRLDTTLFQVQSFVCQLDRFPFESVCFTNFLVGVLVCVDTIIVVLLQFLVINATLVFQRVLHLGVTGQLKIGLDLLPADVDFVPKNDSHMDVVVPIFVVTDTEAHIDAVLLFTQ